MPPGHPVLSLVAAVVVGLLRGPPSGLAASCCQFDSVFADPPCFAGEGIGPTGCPIEGSVCDESHPQAINGRPFNGTCECSATRNGVAVNTSSPTCCYPSTMGSRCEMCVEGPIPEGLKDLPAPPNSTLCFPPSACNSSVLSHTDHKSMLCGVRDPYLSELLKVGFAGFSDGTITAAVHCRGDFLRGNASEDNFEVVTYECQNTTCDCPGCSAFVEAIVFAMHTRMWLECAPDGTCEFWQQELLGGRHINLTCVGSECIPPVGSAPPFRPSLPPAAVDPNALCEAEFLLWHDKYYSRPVNLQAVLHCQFHNCRKVVTHYSPPPPRAWVLSFVVVPAFLLVACGVGLAVYFWRLTRRCEFWQKHVRQEGPPPIVVACKRVSYTVPTGVGRGEARPILAQVSCELHSGRTLAVIGPSGAGKTTFLDILAGRAKTGHIEGTVRVNGEPLTTPQALHIYRRYICAYVMQDDCLPAYLTVTECVLYAAQLRLPLGVPAEEKEARVARVLEELGLAPVAHTRIGSPNNRGISGGEMKRVSIAMQLVISPHMLVLDEPTSGLDSYNAHQVMENLLRAFQHRDPAELSEPPPPGEDSDGEGVESDEEAKVQLWKGPVASRHLPVVVFSIHQPSARIFQLFDLLMVLSRGKVLYHGLAARAVAHFEARGSPCPEGANPADWLLCLATTAPPPSAPGSVGEATPRSSAIVGSQYGWLQGGSPTPPASVRRPNARSEGSAGRAAQTHRPPPKSMLRELQEAMWYYPEFLEQMPVLFWRGIMGMRRHPLLLWAHLVVTLALGGFVGVLYQHLDDCAAQPPGLECQPDLNGIWNRAGGLFFLLAFLALASLSSIDSFQSERILFVRERASGYYGSAAYLFPKLVLDFLPLRVVPAALLACIIYYKIPLGHGFSFGLGLRAGVPYFTWFVTIFCLFNVCAAAMCLTISALCPSPGLSALVSTLYILFLMVFGGIYIRMDSMPDGLKWLRYISFFSSAFELLMVNEINGRTVLFNPVDVDGHHMYNVPQTGYVMLRNMGLVPTETQWKIDACLLLGWTVVYIALGCLFLRWLIRERR